MDGLKYPHIIRALLSRPLAIDPTSIQYAALIDLLVLRSMGGILTADEIKERLSAARNGPRVGGGKSGTVQIIPVYGTIGPRVGMMPNASGGTPLDDLWGTVDGAVKDPGIDAIVLDIDSPGGVVDGVPEFAAKLRAARAQKPIFSIADYSAGSAALWIGAQAEQLWAAPSATVGSIGVMGIHHDLSVAYEEAGEKITLLRSSGAPLKNEATEYEPISADATAEFLRQADYYEAMFHRDMAKGRGVPIDKVRSDFGKGRMLNADDALAAGLVDGIGTLDDVVRLAARTAVERQRDAQASSLDMDFKAGLGSGLPFSDRAPLVSAGLRGFLEHARERADMRAKEGRSFSDADRQGLLEIAGLGEVARQLASDAEDGQHEPAPDPARVRMQRQLAIEAASRGYAVTGDAS